MKQPLVFLARVPQQCFHGQLLVNTVIPGVIHSKNDVGPPALAARWRVILLDLLGDHGRLREQGQCAGGRAQLSR